MDPNWLQFVIRQLFDGGMRLVPKGDGPTMRSLLCALLYVSTEKEALFYEPNNCRLIMEISKV